MIIRYLIIIIITISACNAQKSSSILTSKDVEGTKTNTVAIPLDSVDYSVDYIMGKFDPSTHPEFMIIPPKYRDEDIRYIRKDVMRGFIKMYDAAAKDGVQLIIKSATRNFDNQKRIWENKWTGKTILEDGTNAAKDISDNLTRAKKILEYSSMPSTSRHHWGTDLDFNSFNNKWFETGEGLKLYQWMESHAHIYGFCQTYTQMGSDRNTGYFEEKWHWTYMPVSEDITRQARFKIKNEMIQGFLGAETAVAIDVVQNYILGISPKCIYKQN
jgi:LAS superfamily LD-carboxypeptidase LdcB